MGILQGNGFDLNEDNFRAHVRNWSFFLGINQHSRKGRTRVNVDQIAVRAFRDSHSNDYLYRFYKNVFPHINPARMSQIIDDINRYTLNEINKIRERDLKVLIRNRQINDEGTDRAEANARYFRAFLEGTIVVVGIIVSAEAEALIAASEALGATNIEIAGQLISRSVISTTLGAIENSISGDNPIQIAIKSMQDFIVGIIPGTSFGQKTIKLTIGIMGGSGAAMISGNDEFTSSLFSKIKDAIKNAGFNEFETIVNSSDLINIIKSLVIPVEVDYNRNLSLSSINLNSGNLYISIPKEAIFRQIQSA
jgi:hypothetical protein